MQQLPSLQGDQQTGMRRQYIAQQQTIPQLTAIDPLLQPVSPTENLVGSQLSVPIEPLDAPDTPIPAKKKSITRGIAVVLVLGLIGAIYGIWHSESPANPTSASSSGPSTNQQNLADTNSTSTTTDGIHVYVVGAVKHPGIYTLAPGARVFDLLQAAGGALPNANLVAINLAAKLSDGQEVYVAAVGETPPTTTGSVSSTGSGGNTNGQLVNINTASVDELVQGLHISKKSAQTIVDYRTQHGNFSSVDSLAQVVSRSVYDKIKAQCTV